MKMDQDLVIDFFLDNVFLESDVTISPIFMEQLYMYDPNAPKENLLRQVVTIQSTGVEKITYIAKNTHKLIDAGVIFSTQSLEYYYTGLPELRISLIPDAINDAKLRAQKMLRVVGKY